ncbi:MAG: ribonuclease HII [Candidatus Pacebacteria bacterium]|nr:ribonuclease HII [Candidatus Paceibacterota bacterium]
MHTWVIGIDEVGRGPLAGPIAVGAVALPIAQNEWVYWEGLKDSKKLSEKHREEWYARIKRDALRCAVAQVSAAIIDEKGITYAARLATQRAIQRLAIEAHEARVMLDKNLKAPVEWDQEEFVKGDERFPVIALASIAAKVTRDRYMCRLHAQDTRYGFDQHKGYGTKMHYAALREFGPTEIHRKSFLG